MPCPTITFDKAHAQPNKELYVYQDGESIPFGQLDSSMVQGPRGRQQGAPIPLLCCPGIPVFMNKQSYCGSREGSVQPISHLECHWLHSWSLLEGQFEVHSEESAVVCPCMVSQPWCEAPTCVSPLMSWIRTSEAEHFSFSSFASRVITGIFCI